MLKGLRRKSKVEPASGDAAVPAGQRVYAIGDIHGQGDLFAALAVAIDADDVQRAPCDSTVILLGDLVDRGPDSAGVIDRAMRWGLTRRLRLIAGNHEEMFLEALRDTAMLRHFIRIGGRETILSYGLDAEEFECATIDELQRLAVARVPAAHRDYLAAGEDRILIGDYLFVHAGILPGIAAEAQHQHDLRWIREPFLSSQHDHGCVVVHGHTVTGDVQFLPNRIGIDTGAFLSGRLTALGLEGTQRWLIEARRDDDGITTAVSPA